MGCKHKECEFRTILNSEQDFHYNIIHGIKRTTYQCTTCNFETHDNIVLADHMTSKHWNKSDTKLYTFITLVEWGMGVEG